MWIKQHAKVHWFINSHDDLKYLYISLKYINNSNIIRELQMYQGIISNLINNVEEFCQYYSSLFICEQFNIFIPYDILQGTTLSSSQITNFGIDVSDQEIIKALHEINENKTLGLDGFNSIFLLTTGRSLESDFYQWLITFFK